MKDGNFMLYPLLVSTIAGLSTALGALVIIIRKGISDDGMSFSQGFAAGVMLCAAVLVWKFLL